MSVKQYRDVARIEGNGNNVIDIRVAYRKGGINYATYKTDPRGFSVSATPSEVKDGFRTTAMLSGVGAFLEPAKRFSEKRLHDIAFTALDLPETRQCYESVRERSLASGFPAWDDAKKHLETA